MSGSVDSGQESCPTPGLYRHYKGACYRVLGCVRHSESEERLVLYRALYGERGLWVRPLAMFTASVDVAGEPVPRFALVRGEAGLREREDGTAGDTLLAENGVGDASAAVDEAEAREPSGRKTDSAPPPEPDRT